ncbi:MAG: T9SS type A sorting domain-containing protein, partial [Flavobacteriales bacterium]|nr:T9SS type A sorting domain-containing protein [Flavobacteriales bacterium]
GTLSGGGDVCNTSGDVTLTATPNGDSNTPDGYSLAYVLTSGTDLVIQQLGAEPSFTVNGGGLYTIHTFVFPSGLDLSVVEPGVTTGGDVLALLAANNICASLDVAGAAFNIGNPDAGTLTAVADEVCFETGVVTIAAVPNNDAVIPDGYSLLYVLTEGSGLVIQNVSTTPSFTVATVGTYTIHSFVYPSDLDLSFVVPGVTTGFEVNAALVQGGGTLCASLLVAGAVTEAVECPLCSVDAGTLTGGGEVCSDGNAQLEAVPNGDANVPTGFETIYVLTAGDELVIVNAGATPSFTVQSGGRYTIHTLLYDPATLDLGVVQFGTTTGFDVNSLLIQGGGTICASLDVAGATFRVNYPDAGTLTGGGDVCLENGEAQLTAGIGGGAVVPTGYSQAYVLTSGSGLVIEQLGATPEFTVAQEGLYTIHSFVFPTGLDLSGIVPGVTTGFDVNALLVQGGGELCASLLVAGPQFEVAACENECLANAGSITPNDPLVCWQDEQLVGTPAGNATVPAGYQVLYVLTRGNGLVIRQVNTEPVFTVNQNGIYRIHTLVYDPATLDLSIVQFGTTTGFDVNGLLIQGGGTICASLDVAGAPFIAVGPFICTLLDLFRDVDLNDAQALELAMENMDEGLLKAIENDSPVSITGVWPNPTRDQLNLSLYLVNDQNISISITDMGGKEVVLPRSFTYGTGLNQVNLDVQGLSPGSYMLRIITADNVVTERFMKVD